MIWHIGRCVAFYISVLALWTQPAYGSPDLTGVSLGAAGMRYGTSFAVDSAGVMAAAYFKADQHLYLLHFDKNGWVEERAASSAASLGAANYTRLVFQYDQPHILFHHSMAGKLEHAWRNQAGVWSVEIIDGGADAGRHLSAVPCRSSKICAAYYDPANGNLKFASGRSGEWSTSTIDSSANDVGQFTAITVNAAGLPLISYYDTTLQKPKVAEQDEVGDWTSEILPDIGGYGRWTSVAQARDGTLHLSAGSYFDAYTDSSDGYLYYAKKHPGQTWEVTQFDASHVGAWSSLSLLPDDHPQIATRHMMRSAVFGEVSSVVFAYRDTSNVWRKFDLSMNDDFNFYNGITSLVDHWGNPLVAYFYGVMSSYNLAVHGPADSDHDLLPNYREELHRAIDGNPDSDGDGLADGAEVLQWGSDPAVSDTDGDGTNDRDDKDALDGVAANLIPDGSCDRPLVDRWEPLGAPNNFIKTSSHIKQGLLSLQIDGTGAVNSGVAQRSISLNTSTAYYLRVWYLRSSGSIGIDLGWGSDSDFEGTPLSDAVSTGWTRYSRHFTTPATPGDLRLLVKADGVAYVDGIEVLPAQDADLDGDGISDESDNCPGVSNADQSDADGDAQGDACDTDMDNDGTLNSADCAPSDALNWTTSAYLDGDGDGYPTSAVLQTVACHGASLPGYTHTVQPIDNCPVIANPDQLDTDHDGSGDACDSDRDNDGTPNASDCAPSDASLYQTRSYFPDGDGDDVPDTLAGQMSCVGWAPPSGFTFNAGGADNCPGAYNPAQEDADNDGMGDICDPHPNATPTPLPTATPQPTSAPMPDPTPHPTSGPVPDPMPLPTATPQPTSDPVPDPTPMPTSVPEPTPTISPITPLLDAFVTRGNRVTLISGFLHSSAGSTPIAKAKVSLICGRKRLGTLKTSAGGIVRFRTKTWRVARTCFLKWRGVTSQAFTVGGREALLIPLTPLTDRAPERVSW